MEQCRASGKGVSRPHTERSIHALTSPSASKDTYRFWLSAGGGAWETDVVQASVDMGPGGKLPSSLAQTWQGRADISSSSPLDALLISLTPVTTCLTWLSSKFKFIQLAPILLPLLFSTVCKGPEIGYIVPYPRILLAGYTWHTYFCPPC